MFRCNHVWLALCVIASLASPSQVQGQNQAQDQKQAQGQKQVNIALEGHCPVAAAGYSWRRGRDDVSVVMDGKRYRFTDEKAKATFLANPFPYVPALGGDCIVCWKRVGERIPGTTMNVIRHRSRHFGIERMYLFPEKNSVYQSFLDHPSHFAHADIRNNGKCPITGRKGDTRYAHLEDGHWHLFSSRESKTQYLRRRGS